MDDLLTISDLRRLLGKPAHVLNHALQRHGPEPHGRLGIARVWHRDQLDAIKESLEKTAAVRVAREREAVA